ncbi:hypothetical protein LJC16_02645 [Bacteroidales bacterium OttesenSCG-928-C19]|nr:hypothetical protein [Bacteroidales bacterium OttesenSCG-928-C19]
MTKLNPEKRDKLFASGGTLLFSVLLLILCFQLGLYFQVPPPEEQGVEVALGNSEHGFGYQASQQQQNPEQAQESTPAVQQSQNPNTISTQSTEESISLNNKPKEKPKEERQQQKPQEKPKEPEKPTINQNALFPPRNTGTQEGSGQGDTEGSGYRGNPGGDPNSTRYDGMPGQGGVSFNLKGRSSSSLAKPTYTSKDQGTVVVKIWVDRQGNVIKAQAGERGTTVTDHRLYEMAEQAAMKSSFSPDPNASDMQVGTITYKFIIGGM